MLSDHLLIEWHVWLTTIIAWLSLKKISMFLLFKTVYFHLWYLCALFASEIIKNLHSATLKIRGPCIKRSLSSIKPIFSHYTKIFRICFLKSFLLDYMFSILKGVFAKNERGYRLTAINNRFWSVIILLLSVASIWRKLLKTSHTEERSVHTNWGSWNTRLRS